MSVDYSPAWVEGLKATADYWNINYTNRIGRIANVATALTDPANAPFVTLNPSPSTQQQIIEAANASAGFYGYPGVTYDPSDIAAIVDFRYRNIATQNIDGVDVTFDYKRAFGIEKIDVFANAAYLDLRQRVTPGSPEVTISGQSFEPARFRARFGFTWNPGRLSATVIGNYVGTASNTEQQPPAPVASWTTFDAQLAYAFPFEGAESAHDI
jgi:hypothetical protein